VKTERALTDGRIVIDDGCGGWIEKDWLGSLVAAYRRSEQHCRTIVVALDDADLYRQVADAMEQHQTSTPRSCAAPYRGGVYHR